MSKVMTKSAAIGGSSLGTELAVSARSTWRCPFSLMACGGGGRGERVERYRGAGDGEDRKEKVTGRVGIGRFGTVTSRRGA